MYGRSIPSRAGEPLAPGRGPELARVYPRACGGTQKVGFAAKRAAGLSPRVWGNRIARAAVGGQQGSIPARAGEPPSRFGLHSQARVYPRACGGTKETSDGLKYMRGLSPRVRGNRPLARGGEQTVRSIPARAGEPAAAKAWVKWLGVYPRACGGTGLRLEERGRFEGLSPRVRGNPLQCRVHPELRRSIPARAGEPVPAIARNARPPVYPRACGGTDNVARDLRDEGGLSPRVRGNLQQSRGAIQEQGLSPRVRGNRIIVSNDGISPGSIPARAGEPRMGPGRH